MPILLRLIKKWGLRILSFLWRNRKNAWYVILYTGAVFQKHYENKARFLTDQELIEELRKGKSLLRLGDGEIYMMNQGSVPQYEFYNPKLTDYFYKIVKEYMPSSPYLIGIPTTVNMDNEELKKIGKFQVWLPLKIMYRHFFPKKTKYFDAHLFYRNGGFDRTLKEILKNHKTLIVTKKENIDLIKEKVIGNLNVSFIESPERDAFKDMSKIMSQIIEEVGDEKDKYRVILAVGPTSKAMVYELSKIGVVSYDIGRGIETIYRENEIEHLI